MQPRRARRTDANQAEIVAELESLGVSVALDKDDILVGYDGTTYWFEIKNPDKLKKSGGFKKGAVRKGQKLLAKTWQGQYDIVTSVKEILDIIQWRIKK